MPETSRDQRQQEDHDQLIRIESQIGTLCKKVDRVYDKLDKKDDDCKACHKDLTTDIASKMSWKRFSVIAGIILAVMGTGFYMNQSVVLDNRDKVIELHHDFQDHVKIADEFYETTNKRLTDIEDRHARVDAMDEAN